MSSSINYTAIGCSMVSMEMTPGSHVQRQQTRVQRPLATIGDSVPGAPVTNYQSRNEPKLKRNHRCPHRGWGHRGWGHRGWGHRSSRHRGSRYRCARGLPYLVVWLLARGARPYLIN
ncbi:hypothetical protein Bbelb_265740 [Branchiostoma belcheri]|nr:hypothetical protein Bbelb_265740 [Branchiostoma belcheri]